MLFEAPRPEDLGPDPELPGVRTAAVCPLATALGRREECRAAECPWFRVPGTVRICAVEQWAPAARRNPRIARWFDVRRKEILAGRGIWAQRGRSP
jgi:hypothetical protein